MIIERGAKIGGWVVDEGPFSGTYGEVYVLRHDVLGLRRALKRLHPHVVSNVIKEEALKLMKVRSPYVVEIVDYWDAESAILMEYCPLGLDSHLKRSFARTKCGLPYEEAQHLLLEIVDGLNAAHHAGIIHGDIKPANVRFGGDGVEGRLGSAKLADFGAARHVRDASHGIRGSTNWMAPETIERGAVSLESDYFSLGVLAYLVLAGRHPFFAEDPSCLTGEEDNIRDSSFIPKSLLEIRNDIPGSIAELVMLLLAREPSARGRGYGLLRAGLATNADGAPPTGETRPTPVSKALKQATRVLPPNNQELSRLLRAYRDARDLFFAAYSPRQAIETLEGALAELRWERFRRSGSDELADCWSLIAYIRNSSLMLDESIAAASNGLEVNPDSVNCLHTRGYAYINRAQYKEAVDDLSKAVEKATDPKRIAQISRLLETARSRASQSAVASPSPDR